MTDLREEIHRLGQRARKASRALALLSSDKKNAILRAMADGLLELANKAKILQANAQDLAAGEAKGLSKAMLDRLMLNESRLTAMSRGVREVADLPDPVGEVLQEWERPNGLHMRKVRVPIGVIGVIYESRPNVTSDAAVLCLKSGNATILRGGSEAFQSSMAIAAVLQAAGEKAGLPADSVQLVPFTDRESVKHMAEMDKYLDLIIPRGGKGLIETVVSLARMPVIKHYDGICHIYIDREADLEMAREIVLNAKCQKPSACNAAETVLVHREIAEAFLTDTGKALLQHGVELRGDAPMLRALGGHPRVKGAVEQDYRTEHLDLILSVKTVGSVDDAIAHIAEYSSRHTDVIITRNEQTAQRFMAEVDSSVVLWNASTRFNDGGEFGFGCEIGISTDKLHARGPMGLPELTIYKYLVTGAGQVRA